MFISHWQSWHFLLNPICPCTDWLAGYFEVNQIGGSGVTSSPDWVKISDFLPCGLKKKLNWSSHINTRPTRAGEWLRTLRWAAHICYLTSVQQLQDHAPGDEFILLLVSLLCICSSINVQSSVSFRMKQCNLAHYSLSQTLTSSTNIAMLFHGLLSIRCTAAICQGIFWAHLTNPQKDIGKGCMETLPSVPLQILHWPDLEIYFQSINVLGLNHGSPYLTAVWQYIHHMGCSRSKGSSSQSSERHFRMGNNCYLTNNLHTP